MTVGSAQRAALTAGVGLGESVAANESVLAKVIDAQAEYMRGAPEHAVLPTLLQELAKQAGGRFAAAYDVTCEADGAVRLVPRNQTTSEELADLVIPAADPRFKSLMKGELVLAVEEGVWGGSSILLAPVPSSVDNNYLACVLRVWGKGDERVATSSDFPKFAPLVRACGAILQSRALVDEIRSSWRETFDAVSLALIAVDENCRIVRMNRAARELFGVTYAQAIGRPLGDVARAEPWLSAERVLVACIRDKVSKEVKISHDDPGRAWEISVNPMDAAGARALLVARDMTVTRELQRALRRVETVAALGRITVGVAHEVRNPLFSIGATLDAFEARFGASAEHKPFFSVLRKEIKRLASLMTELLEYGRPPSISKEDRELSDLLAEAVRHCAALATDKGVVIESLAEDGRMKLSVDGRRMVQVFINLIENGIQHCDRGGRVQIVQSLEATGGTRWAKITIDDDGPGFAVDALPHIFEPFFTKRRGGTGLGLSIVQRIIEQHGGRIHAENRAEKGARLTVRLQCPEEARES